MQNIYQRIAERTNGDIYIGVVGPVRTGKSTFIKRFMDLAVLPRIENERVRTRAIDELPQSAAGKTIMTTEPKFIPNNAVEIDLGDNTHMKVRLIDCVGYIVDNAIGYEEDDKPRMVKTPWFDEEIPFNQAADLGTKKVINEHSTIGVVITTDGSVTEFSRSDYLDAEERVVSELVTLGKPFVIIINSSDPDSEECRKLARELEEKYHSPVHPINCAMLAEKDIMTVFESLLMEFPIEEIGVQLPSWIDRLQTTHYLKSGILHSIREGLNGVGKLADVRAMVASIGSSEHVGHCRIDDCDMSTGKVLLNIDAKPGMFYKVLGESTGFEISDEGSLLELMRELSIAKREYDKLSFAIHEVRQRGYGVVSPTIDELTLEEPEIVKQGGRFGVRLRASAPSIHMIRADIETEVSPVVGTEKQSEELVKYLLSEFEIDPKKIWESNIFGKSLHELVNEGLHSKLSRMPLDAQGKLRETLEKIINEGSGGLICIIL